MDSWTVFDIQYILFLFLLYIYIFTYIIYHKDEVAWKVLSSSEFRFGSSREYGSSREARRKPWLRKERKREEKRRETV